MLDHVDLPPDPACARFYEADSRVRTVSRSQVRQPVNARGLGRWRPYAEELAPLIEELERAGALEGWRDAARRPGHVLALNSELDDWTISTYDQNTARNPSQ